MHNVSRLLLAAAQVVAAFGLLLLAGCTDQPSGSAGQSAIETKIQQEAQGRCRLIEFKKTDGQMREVAGVKVYRLEYDLTIEFSEACKWLYHPMLGLSFRTGIPPQSLGALEQIAYASDPSNQGEIVQVGERRKITGSIEFERTENGWRVGASIPAPTNIVRIAAVSAPLSTAKTGGAVAPVEASDSSRLFVGIWLVRFQGATRNSSPALPVIGQSRNVTPAQPSELDSLNIWHLKADGTIGYGPDGDLNKNPFPSNLRINFHTWEALPRNRVMLSSGDPSDISCYVFSARSQGDTMTWAGSNGAVWFTLTQLLPTAITPEMRAKFVSGLQAAAIEAQGKAILNNLRQLAAAADQFYLENGVSRARYDQLVGPTKYVKELHSVAGEDYSMIQFEQGKSLQVRTSDGRVVNYNY